MDVTQEQIEKFNKEGREFVLAHPDFNEVLAAAGTRNLKLPNEALRECTRLGGLGAEVAYYLSKPENEHELRAITVSEGERVNDERVADKIRRIASRLERHGTFKTITQKHDEVEAYLAQRREDRRSGKRRR